MITRCTQLKCLRRPGRAKGILSATLLVAVFAATAAQAATLTGMVNTGSSDGTFSSPPTNGPFPVTLTVGEFDFSVPGGQRISAGTFSGDFGSSNLLGSATGQGKLFVDGVQLALCAATCEADSEVEDVAWTYSLTTADLTQLSTNALWESGRAVITAQQLSASQLVLDPTSVNLTPAPVPIPPALFLLVSALAPLFGFGRRKAGAA